MRCLRSRLSFWTSRGSLLLGSSEAGEEPDKRVNSARPCSISLCSRSWSPTRSERSGISALTSEMVKTRCVCMAEVPTGNRKQSLALLTHGQQVSNTAHRRLGAALFCLFLSPKQSGLGPQNDRQL